MNIAFSDPLDKHSIPNDTLPEKMSKTMLLSNSKFSNLVCVSKLNKLSLT